MTESLEWKANGRPLSTIALNFSAALDDLFKLGTVGELEANVEQKSRAVETQKSQLEDLDTQLRQADEKIRIMEIKHKRMSRLFSSKTSSQALSGIRKKTSNNSDSDDTETTSSSLG